MQILKVVFAFFLRVLHAKVLVPADQDLSTLASCISYMKELFMKKNFQKKFSVDLNYLFLKDRGLEM